MTPHKTCPACERPIGPESIEETRKVVNIKGENFDPNDIAWNYINRQEAQIDKLAPAKGIINGILFSSIFWILIILLIQIVSKP
jgi:hypothetical protein